MTPNLNSPALRPGPLHDGDFVPTMPAEAATSVGCDEDDDAGEWHAARVRDLLPMPLWVVALALVAAAASVVLVA